MPDGYVLKGFNAAASHRIFAPYFAHLKYQCDPSILLQFPDDVLRGFVQGMIDSEGYITDKYTDIANKNRALLNALVQMFARLGRQAKVYDSPSQNVAHLRLKPD